MTYTDTALVLQLVMGGATDDGTGVGAWLLLSLVAREDTKTPSRYGE